MAYQPHATVEQLAQWIITEGLPISAPTDAARYLRSASMIVDQYLQDCPPIPADNAEAQQATTDATLIQACYWIENNIHPLTEDLQSGQTVASASLLSGSMTFADSDMAAKNRAHAGYALCLEARVTLGLAGIHPTTSVRVVG